MESKPSIIEVEKSCLRLVTRAIRDFWPKAREIFSEETDLPQDVAEDVTQEALTDLGISKIPMRLYGKIDYKRAAFLFLPDREVEVALLVDSKAEKKEGQNTATIQMSQTSMEIRQKRAGRSHRIQGELPPFIQRENHALQTVTIIVKYIYKELAKGTNLISIKLACIPNGLLQDDFNPNEQDTIWLAGRNAPTLGEEFRVRLSFEKLKAKAAWRVVEINK